MVLQELTSDLVDNMVYVLESTALQCLEEFFMAEYSCFEKS